MVKNLHICILTSAHSVDDVRLYKKVALSFIVNGFRVSWVGPRKKYIQNSDTNYEQSGIEYHLFEPYKTRLGRLFSCKLGLLANRIKNVDVYFAAEPDSAYIARKLARMNKAKSVFDVHELYHCAQVGNWAPKMFQPIAICLVKFLIGEVCSKVDLVIGVSDGVLAPYIRRCRASIVVRNCALLNFAVEKNSAYKNSPDADLVIMHGKSTKYNGTSVVLQAISELSKIVPDRCIRIKMFKWFDRDPIRSEKYFMLDIENLKLGKYIEIYPPTNSENIAGILAHCDVGLIAHDRNLSSGTQPNRLYEYMAAGLAVLAPVYDEGIAPILQEERCGLLVEFEDPKAVAKAIQYLCENYDECVEMGARGKAAFHARHNWEREIAPVINMIRLWGEDKI